MISKQKEIFNKLVDERLDEITELDEKVNTDNLIYKYKGHTADLKFNKFDNSHILIKKIKKGEISLDDTKNNQIKSKWELDEIKKANKKNKSREQKKKKKTLYNSEMLYKGRSNVIKIYDDYSSMVSEAKHKVIKGPGLKILTP